MNYLFLLNASVLFILSIYLHASKREELSLHFLIFCSGLGAWNVCVFLMAEFQSIVNLDVIARIQLVTVLIYVNGIYYFCCNYPLVQVKKKYILNLIGLVLLSAAILFSDYVVLLDVIDNELVSINAAGFIFYALYITFLLLATANNLILKYRQYPDYHNRIKYLLIGLGIFMVLVLGGNIALSQIGRYDYLALERLSGIFPTIFIAYAIAKYDFMDVAVIINRKTAWILTAGIIFVSFILGFQISPENEVLTLGIIASLGLFWTIYGIAFQNLMLTSARRKFIRSWYNTEDLISEISSQITAEKNRESIFILIEKIIDDTFQLERSELIFSVRDDSGSLTHYINLKRNSGGVSRTQIQTSPLVEIYSQATTPDFFEDCDPVVQHYLTEQGYKPGKECIVVPFHSPEYLEGIIILGERSSQEVYSRRDLKFFHRLVKYMSAILYRLTPFEKLESQYFENKQKLHEAEIQLIRAQKTESIVHATRQCHHEIRTPLNIIRLGIGRIKTLADLKAYKIMAKEEISRALEIVDETLAITDVSKSSEDRRASFDVNEVLQRCVRLVDTNRFSVVVNEGDIPEITGIMSDIQVVITNLLHNAMDAMPDGGELCLSSSCLAQSIIIEVTDNGAGIPKNLRSKVWEPYFSGHDTEVGNSNAGRGWGLTIVNRIVTEHRGTINFTSELGLGTKFTISLPLF